MRQWRSWNSDGSTVVALAEAAIAKDEMARSSPILTRTAVTLEMESRPCLRAGRARLEGEAVAPRFRPTLPARRSRAETRSPGHPPHGNGRIVQLVEQLTLKQAAQSAFHIYNTDLNH